MWKNYVKSALRAFYKNRLYTITNLTGLSIGMACVILILLWVQHELSYDRFHQDANRIYRLQNHYQYGDNVREDLLMPGAFSDALKEEISYITEATRILSMGQSFFQKNEVKEYEGRIIATNDTFFKVFSFKLIERSGDKLLDEPFKVILSQKISTKYFGKEDPIGKTILIDNKDYIVTGIIEDNPGNSHIQYDIIKSDKFLDSRESWDIGFFYIFFKTNKDVDPLQLHADLNSIASRYRKGNSNDYYAKKLVDIHLRSNLTGHAWEGQNGSIQYVILFSTIALVILIIACINYVNLTTAYSLQRIKEVAIKKIVGATRGQIVIQYLGESIFLCMISMILAGVLVELMLPFFNDLISSNLSFQLLHTDNLFLIVAASVLIGLISGVYTATAFSRIKSEQILKSSSYNKTFGITRLKKILVGIQFFISLSLLIAALAISRQLNYVQNKRLGFDKDQLMTLLLRRDLSSNSYGSFKNEIMQLAEVENVAYGPSFGMSMSTNVLPDDLSKDAKGYNCSFAFVDYAFIKTMGINLVQGRDFDLNHRLDSVNSIIINQSAARKFGWDEPLGRTIKIIDPYVQSDDGKPVYKEYNVIGVVQDYHFRSLKAEIAPMILQISSTTSPYAVILRFHTANPQNLISNMEKIWKKFVPSKPFDYQFLDDYYAALYKSETRLSEISYLFTGLAIFLSVLGLAGIFSLSAENRKKEIGIRKVMGASVARIIKLLINDFTKIILFSSLFAIPLAWYGITKWMESFAYKAPFSIWIYAGAIASLVIITWTALIYQAIRSSMTNPVNVLRNE